MKKVNSKRPVEPPGLERKILAWLPRATIASIVVPALFYFATLYFPPATPDANLEKTVMTAGIVAIAVAITLWTAIFTIAIGCWIVVLMKGPARFADRYELPDSDQPRKDEE